MMDMLMKMGRAQTAQTAAPTLTIHLIILPVYTCLIQGKTVTLGGKQHYKNNRTSYITCFFRISGDMHLPNGNVFELETDSGMEVHYQLI